jgi:hypothetical protein
MPVFYPPVNRLPSGSSGAPSVAFAEDASMGFYRSSDDYTGFSVNGVASLRFTSGGSMLGASLDNQLILSGDGGVELVSAGVDKSIRVGPTGSGSLIVGTYTAGLGVVDALKFRVSGAISGEQLLQTWESNSGASKMGRFGIEYDSGEASFVWRDLYSYGASLAEKMRLRPGGLMLGKSTDAGNGVIQLVSHSSAGGGLAFGTSGTGSETLWRHAAGILRTAGELRAAAFQDGSGNKLLGSRVTGWNYVSGGLEGPARRLIPDDVFLSATPEIVQLGQVLNTLIKDLHGSSSYHGLLGT